jgi:glycosyltransferase involved in cell wall biosynthesis
MDTSQYEIGIFCVNDTLSRPLPAAIRIIKSSRPSTRSLRYVLGMRKAIREFDPDLVHVWLPPAVSIPAMLFSGLLGKKIIFSYRTAMRFFRKLSYIEFVFVHLFAHKIISNRQVTDAHPAYRRLFELKDGSVIPNAVSVPPEHRRPPGDLGEPVRFVFIGRLCDVKNGLRLVQALAAVRSSVAWHLDVFGIGDEWDEMAALIEHHGLGQRITLQGYCHDIYPRMARADALLFPSLLEGMPNVLVEALCIGLPVVASDIAANRAVIGDEPCAIWMDPLDIADMAGKITQFLENQSGLAARIESGKGVAARYSLDGMVERYQHQYSELFATTKIDGRAAH